MRDVNVLDPRSVESIFERPDYVQEVIQRIRMQAEPRRSFGVGLFLLGERRQGLTTFARRELMPALQNRGLFSVYLPMKGFLLQDPALRLRNAMGLNDRDKRSSVDAVQSLFQERPTDMVLFFDDVDLLQLTDQGRELQWGLKMACNAIDADRDQRRFLRLVGLSSESRMLSVMTSGPNAIWPGAAVERFRPMDLDYVCWFLAHAGDQLAPRLRDEDVVLDCSRRSRYCPGVLREVLL